jgi:hypothetical protein
MDAERHARSRTIEERKTPSPTDQHCTAMDAEKPSDYADARKPTPIHRHKKLKLKRRHDIDDNKENITQQVRGDSLQLKEKQQQQSPKVNRDLECRCTISEFGSNEAHEHGRNCAEHKIEIEKESDSDLKLVESAYQYITDKTYPPGSTKNEKRSIRRKADKLVVVNGELLYRKKDGSEVT